MCGVQPKDRQRAMDWMLLLGLNETIHLLDDLQAVCAHFILFLSGFFVHRIFLLGACVSLPNFCGVFIWWFQGLKLGYIFLKSSVGRMLALPNVAPRSPFELSKSVK